MPPPTFVFKIVTEQPNLGAEKVDLSELDVQSGFIHLSTGKQIPHTCNRFFSTTKKLVIIKLPYQKLEHNMKWEPAPGTEKLFPHLYSDLWTRDVESTRTFHRGKQSWLDVLGKEQWLLDSADIAEDE
jgi:uncharacterized protein (DUF952 family)